MKKIIFSFIVCSLFATALFMVPVKTFAEETTGDDTAVLASNDMVHFIMTVKWGNVLGEKTDKSETNFDGSIAVSSDGKISLIRELLFEKHNETADKITSKENPISWTSLIYGHWDGIRVLVSSPAGADVTISTSQGSVTKTAKEFYEATKPIIQDVGNNKEIVIKTHPTKKRAFIMKLIWGKVDKNDYAATIGCDIEALKAGGIKAKIKSARCRLLNQENFSGSLSLTGGATMKFIRALRFEKNDKINSQSESDINWTSNIYGGVDGLLVKFALDKNITKDTKATLKFDEQDFEKSISLLELYHKRIIKNEVKPGYGVWASIWSFPDRKLIRAKGRPEVYVIEDEIKRHIPNPRVFEDQSLNWNDVEEVEPDEIDVITQGDALSYSEGTLIQGSGPEVYAIANSKKLHIRNPAVFNKLVYDWKNIIKVDNSELALYPTGDNLDENSQHPDSTLVQVEGDPTVYVTEGDKLKPIPSVEVFNSNNLKWNRIKKITPGIRAAYKIGKNVEFGDGALIRDEMGKVFRIDKGKKRWIRSGDDFNKAGFKWDRIVDAKPSEVAALEGGEDVVSEDITSVVSE